MEENHEAGAEKGATEPQKEGFGPIKLPLPGDAGVGRREGGGHFYLVTKESHTIVLFSALGRVGACIYQRDRGRCGNHTSGPPNPDVLYPEAIAER